MSTETEGEAQTLTINDEVFELEVELNPLVATKDIHIDLKRKESSWANIQSSPKKPPTKAIESTIGTSTSVSTPPSSPKESPEKEEVTVEEKEKANQETVETPTPKKRGRKPKVKREEKEPRQRSTNSEKKQTDENKDKEGEKEEEKEKAEESSDSEEPEENFELEKILDHRVVKRRKRMVNEYLVRWLGYGAESDTWEPEENILGDSAKEQITIFWEEKKEAEKIKNKPKDKSDIKQEEAADIDKALSEPPAKKQKTEETVARKRKPGRPKSFSTSETPKSANEPPTNEPPENAPPSLPTSDIKPPDFSSSGGSNFDISSDTNTWYGIKEEDIKNKAAKREMKNLYVANRIPSLSEKLLADFGTSSTGRVTRSSLKPLKEDVDPSFRESKTPEPSTSGRRGRRTVSPAASTSNRYSPEPPAPKRTRKSMPAIKEADKHSKEDFTSSKKDLPSIIEPNNDETEIKTQDISKTPSADVQTVPTTDSQPKSQIFDSSNSSTKSASKPKKAGPAPLSLVPQTSLIPEKVRPVTTTPKFSSNETTVSKGNLPPQIRVRPMQPPTEAKAVPPQESLDKVQSPHILDPIANRIFAETKTIKPTPTSPPPSDKTKSDQDEILQILTQDDFQGLKDKPFPEVDMEQCYEEITSTAFSVRKIARNYDEFVAAVLTGDAEIVYSTAMIGTFDLKLNEVDSKGKSILHHIAERKCDETHPYDSIIEILVQKKADLSLADKENLRTPLHTAIVLRHTCLAKMFIQLGSPINTLDSKKFSPLISAMNTRDANLVKILLNAGANVEKGIIYSERSKATTDEITDMLIAHRTKIVTCLDEARNYILPQASVATYSTLPTSLYITPLAESDVIEYAFHLTKDTTIRPPNNYLLFECAVLDLDNLNETMSARMWQQSPIRKIIINGNEPINLHKTTNFISLPSLFEGTNSVRIELMNQVYKGTRFCLTARLAHVFMAGFSRSKRLEPTVGNLLPQMMGNPSGYKAHVAPGIRQLAQELRPKYFRTPGQQFSQHSLPHLQQPPSTKRSNVQSRPYSQIPNTVTSSSSHYRSPLSASSFIPTTTPSPFNFGVEQQQSSIRSPTTPSSATPSPLPPGFIPLKAFAPNGTSSSTSSASSSSLRTGANRPMFAPLSAASNRIGLRAPLSSSAATTHPPQPRSYATPSSTASTIPRLQRQ
jgi:hypothetical protein